MTQRALRVENKGYFVAQVLRDNKPVLSETFTELSKAKTYAENTARTWKELHPSDHVSFRVTGSETGLKSLHAGAA